MKTLHLKAAPRTRRLFKRAQRRLIRALARRDVKALRRAFRDVMIIGGHSRTMASRSADTCASVMERTWERCSACDNYTMKGHTCPRWGK